MTSSSSPFPMSAMKNIGRTGPRPCCGSIVSHSGMGRSSAHTCPATAFCGLVFSYRFHAAVVRRMTFLMNAGISCATWAVAAATWDIRFSSGEWGVGKNLTSLAGYALRPASEFYHADQDIATSLCNASSSISIILCRDLAPAMNRSLWQNTKSFKWCPSIHGFGNGFFTVKLPGLSGTP